MTVVLGLGSNSNFACSDGTILHPVDVLDAACADLRAVLKNIKVSSVYRSAPMYVTDQNDFFNMVVAGDYDGTPIKLLHAINKIEAKWGRNRENEIRNGPRILDIDIEIFGDKIINTKKLTIPHKKIKERQFVLLPLLEILPKSADPISKEKFAHIAARLPDQNVQKIVEVQNDRSTFITRN